VIPGDKKVTLTWDDQAEYSFDPFLQEYDFEGYRIYRTSEPELLEAKIITDAYGRPKYKQPIAQFDLKNDISGLHPIHVEGAHYNLGNNTGLRHVYVDDDVQNGMTYYYAVVSYDRGHIDTSAVGVIEGISPAECASVIKQDISGNIETDINTAVVTPNPAAIGYLSPGLKQDIRHEGPGTGSVEYHFVFEDSVLDGRDYEVVFSDTAKFHNEGTPFYTIYDVTSGDSVLLVDETEVYAKTETPIFNGMILNLYNDDVVKLDEENTGWLVGESNYHVFIDFDPRFTSETNPIFDINIPYPADFEIRFSDTYVDTSNSGGLGSPEDPTKFQVYNRTEDIPANFMFRDAVEDGMLTPDTTETILLFVENEDEAFKINTTWRISFATDTLQPVIKPPQPGDIFRISTLKPFRTGDRFYFSVRGAQFDQDKAEVDLDKISVVPNPYVAAASWEPRNPYRFGRGERRIWFINLPSECTIRIYTTRGYLLDTIEHRGSMTEGAETWDLVSKDGMDIAYGVYVYHVEAPGIGEKIGKFAVIK
jgi:hypothetical protein